MNRNKCIFLQLFDQLRHSGYKICDRIGEGAYSKVYKALDLQRRCDAQTSTTFDYIDPNPPTDQTSNQRPNDDVIACKIFDCRRSSNDYINKFLPRELQISRRVQHPNIVRVQRIFEIGPFICCLMELCPSGDLLQCVQDNGPRPETQSHLWFNQLVAAVRYLHSQGISHRDIKCENVLLCSDSHCKLTDFGFARVLDYVDTASENGNEGAEAVDDASRAVCLSETFCGSVAYAAPEVLCGRPYDPRAYDMWSLGCVLFIMVTGTMPFGDESVAVALQAQQQRVLYWPFSTAVPPALRATVVGMLEPVVERRTTMETLLADEWMLLGG